MKLKMHFLELPFHSSKLFHTEWTAFVTNLPWFLLFSFECVFDYPRLLLSALSRSCLACPAFYLHPFSVCVWGGRWKEGKVGKAMRWGRMREDSRQERWGDQHLNKGADHGCGIEKREKGERRERHGENLRESEEKRSFMQDDHIVPSRCFTAVLRKLKKAKRRNPNNLKEENHQLRESEIGSAAPFPAKTRTIQLLTRNALKFPFPINHSIRHYKQICWPELWIPFISQS